MQVWVTPDMFKNSPFGGFDLREAVTGMYENDSIGAELFIEAVTEHLVEWIDTETFRNFRWDRLTPFQIELWQKAIIAQTTYSYKEGPKAFGMSSGSDDEKGKIMDLSYIQSLEVCTLSQRFMSRAGIMNLNIKNRKRTWPNGSNYGFF